MADSAAVALARRMIEIWALAGALLLVGVVLATVSSVAMSALAGAPLAGDFEIVTVGIGVAAFGFLPYCQLTGANVSADIFTARAGPRTVARLALLAALVALVFSLVLVWRMGAGLADYLTYRETTAILGFPLWIAFIPILISLALLVVASLINLAEAARQLARGR